MKEQAYEDYCSQVCDVMQKATKAERRCLTEELTDHMESHVEALLEEGWPEDEAVRYAVEAMGDPETVGRQYDEKLSSFWRICGVMLRWILILMVVNLLTGPVRVSFIQFYDSLMARWNPHLKYEDTMREGTLARRDLDIRIPREGRQTNVYRLDLGYDAQRRMEIREGWGSGRQIWKEQQERKLTTISNLCLYAIDDSFVLAEQNWDIRQGWNDDPMCMVETREDRPIQVGYGYYHRDESHLLYLVGKITDPHVELEDITYQLSWADGVKEEYTIRPEDCFLDQGTLYYVRGIDIVERAYQGDGTQSCTVLLRVWDDHGDAIRWDHGYADDLGDWMIVHSSTIEDK